MFAVNEGAKISIFFNLEKELFNIQNFYFGLYENVCYINWFSYFHLVKAMYFNDRASFYLIGIRPDFQNKGITALIFNEMLHVFHKHNIQYVETNPELKDNLAIQQLWKHYQKRLHKKRVTYGKNIA